ncbi:MAG: hypothetical protein K2X43_01645 [Hyphomonadaceae bacterium]|jgi:hypothetical protein|nr:hypothetical protein [Hyphomonadaceae bacterium]
MALAKEAFITSLLMSFGASECVERPYKYWLAKSCLPQAAVEQVLDLPFPAPTLDGVSGKREMHNATRKYFDVENRSRFPVCEGLCQAFQAKAVTEEIRDRFGARLSGTYLRVEMAQDTEGFWLEPHSDLGVKTFTMLLYLSKDAQHATLGTDI